MLPSSDWFNTRTHCCDFVDNFRRKHDVSAPDPEMSTFVDNRTQPHQSTLVDISIERVKHPPLLNSGTIFLCWVKRRYKLWWYSASPATKSLCDCNQPWTANPIDQHVLHNTVARSHVSPTYGLRASASGYWHARTHASNRGFLSNANLAIICCIFWFAALYLLPSSEVLSTFIVYIHNWRRGQ